MGSLTIVGLGPGAREHLPLGVLEALRDHKEIYLRTEKHPTLDYLREEGIKYKSFDFLYQRGENFQEVYQEIADSLIEKARERDILYGVPGHPLVAEESVQLLIQACDREGIRRKIYPAMSFLDAIFSALEIDPIEGFKLLDGLQLEEQEPDPSVINIVSQVYDPLIASQVKLRLMDYYRDEEEVIIVQNAGIPGLERIERLPLFQLDRLKWVDYLTSLCIPRIDTGQKKYYNVNNLVEIMEVLRSEGGCPWDRDQTHDSLKPHLIEESYEVLEALNKKDDFLLEEELGDLLLQIIFHSQLAKERDAFSLREVVHGICEKLIFRHPHVFSDLHVDTIEGVEATWEEQKRKEKQIESIADSMKRIPKELPALLKSEKIQNKAADVGFDWDKLEDVVDKVKEELHEAVEAWGDQDPSHIKEEAGDLLFAVVNLLRFLKVNPEIALNAACNKFINRFEYIENQANKVKKDLRKMKLKEMDILWDESKEKNVKF